MIKASVEYADATRTRGRIRGNPAEIKATMRREMFQLVAKSDPKLVADLNSRMTPAQIDALLVTVTAHPIIAPVLEI